MIRNIGKAVAKNPFGREAVTWGGAGAVGGALTAKPGESRFRRAVAGGAVGAASGAVAGGLGAGLRKFAENGTNHSMHDLKGRAADKYPVSEVPTMSDEVMALAESAKMQFLAADKPRVILTGGA